MHMLRRVWRSVSVSHRIHLWGVFGVTSVEPDVEGPAWGTKGKFWGLYPWVVIPSFLCLTRGDRLESLNQNMISSFVYGRHSWWGHKEAYSHYSHLCGRYCARCTGGHSCRLVVFPWIPPGVISCSLCMYKLWQTLATYLLFYRHRFINKIRYIDIYVSVKI